jgi:hypothetical protein
LTKMGVALDNAIRRRQTFQVKNEGSNVAADDSSGTSVSTATFQSNRPQWLRTLANAATTPYALAADVSVGAGQSSYLMGEFSDQTQANAELRRTRINATGGQRAVSGGKWQRLWLDAAAGSYYRFGGSGQRSGLILEDCGVNGGALLLDGCASTSNPDWGFNFRNGIIIPKAEATKAFSSSARFGNVTGAFIWSVWENMLVYGPTATQTTPAGAGFTVLITSTNTGAINATTTASQSRPFAFRDCVFIMQRATDASVVSISSDHPVTFENCRFFSISGHALGSAFVAAAGANITMRDCIVFDHEGMAIDAGPTAGLSGTFENCTFIAGFGSAALANPQPAYFTGNNFGLHILNCRIIVSTDVFRSNAGAPNAPMVVLKNAAGGNLNVKGLMVTMAGTAGNSGTNPIVDVTPTNGVSGRITIEDLDVNLGGNAPLSTWTTPLVSINGSSNRTAEVRVNRLRLHNANIPVGGDYSAALVSLSACWVDGITVWTPVGGAGTGRWDASIRLGSSTIVKNIEIINGENSRCVSAPIKISGDNNIIEGIASPLNPIVSSGTPLAHFIYCIGNQNRVASFRGATTNNGASGVVFDGRDNQLADCHLDGGASSTVPLVDFLGASNRRNRCCDSTFFYSGAANANCNAVRMAGPECLIVGCTAYRNSGSGGSIATAFQAPGLNSVVGATIVGTTL